MVEARLGDRVRDRELAVDDVDDHLQHRGDDAAAAGGAGDEKRLAVLEHDGRRHRREWALARSRRVGVAADETIGIGRARLGGEIVEFVVEQDAGALGDEAETVAEVERGGVGHRVAEAIDHREVRGVVALARRRKNRTEARRRGGAGGIDARAQRFGEAFGCEIGRRRDARGIAEKFRAVEIGALHRFDHEMDARRRVDLAQTVSLENVQHLDQRHAARGGRRHRDDAIAAIAAGGGGALDRLVVLKILARHDATRRADGGDELVGDGAAIEPSRPLAGDCGQRVGEVALQQRRAGGERTAVGEEDLGRGGPARQA